MRLPPQRSASGPSTSFPIAYAPSAIAHHRAELFVVVAVLDREDVERGLDVRAAEIERRVADEQEREHTTRRCDCGHRRCAFAMHARKIDPNRNVTSNIFETQLALAKEDVDSAPS